MCVGWDLRMIVLSGGRVCLVGFPVLVIFVGACDRQRTTLFDRDCLSCVMCSSRVCLRCRGGCKLLVRISLVFS